MGAIPVETMASLGCMWCWSCCKSNKNIWCYWYKIIKML